jgi:hypothetical protein
MLTITQPQARAGVTSGLCLRHVEGSCTSQLHANSRLRLKPRQHGSPGSVCFRLQTAACQAQQRPTFPWGWGLKAHVAEAPLTPDRDWNFPPRKSGYWCTLELIYRNNRQNKWKILFNGCLGYKDTCVDLSCVSLILLQGFIKTNICVLSLSRT